MEELDKLQQTYQRGRNVTVCGILRSRRNHNTGALETSIEGKSIQITEKTATELFGIPDKLGSYSEQENLFQLRGRLTKIEEIRDGIYGVGIFCPSEGRYNRPEFILFALHGERKGAAKEIIRSLSIGDDVFVTGTVYNTILPPREGRDDDTVVRRTDYSIQSITKVTPEVLAKIADLLPEVNEADVISESGGDILESDEWKEEAAVPSVTENEDELTEDDIKDPSPDSGERDLMKEDDGNAVENMEEATGTHEKIPEEGNTEKSLDNAAETDTETEGKDAFFDMFS